MTQRGFDTECAQPGLGELKPLLFMWLSALTHPHDSVKMDSDG